MISGAGSSLKLVWHKINISCEAGQYFWTYFVQNWCGKRNISQYAAGVAFATPTE